MVLCVSHELISPKLKILAFSQEYVIGYEIGFGIGFELWICYRISLAWFWILDFGYDMKFG